MAGPGKKSAKKLRVSASGKAVVTEDEELDEELRHKAGSSPTPAGEAAAAAAAADDEDEWNEESLEAQYSEYALSQMEVNKQDNESHLCGAIKSLELRNFMNHEHYKAIFGRNVNFIVGVNGSGKSAILTGLTLVLGGQVRSTGRKDFIREGQESGELVVIITNNGGDAYKPELYGDSIKITRIFRKSGSSSWKTGPGNSEKTIKTSAAEVRAIADHFNFQVDNPIAVLNQDMTKKFMQSSSKKDKYDFFEKGTKIDVIKENYGATETNAFKIGKANREAVGELERLLKECKDAERDFQEAKKLQEMEETIKTYEKYGAWRHIFDLEERLKRSESKLTSVNKERDEIADKVKTYEEKAAHARAEALDKEKEQRELDKRVTELHEQTKELAVARKKRQAVEKKRKRAETELKFATDKKASLETEKANAAAKAEAEGEAKRYERQTKVSKLEQSLQKLQSELDHASNAFYRSRDEQSTFEKEAESATRHADAAREKAHHARQALKSVSAGSKDPLALYPHDVQTVHRAIRKEKRWSAFPPIGPIGLHVEPKETKWVPAISFALGASVHTFIVGNDADRKTLQRIAKAANARVSIISKKEEPKYQIPNRVDTRSLNPKEAVVCEDAVVINNDQVYNFLVDRTQIHATVLFTDDTACKQFADRAPKYLTSALTTTRGRAIPSDNGTRARWFVDKSKYTNVIAKDMSSLVAERKKEAEALEAEARELANEASDASKRASAAKRNIKDFAKKKAAIEAKQEKLERELNALRATDIDDDNDVTGIFEQIDEDLTQTVDEIQNTQAVVEKLLNEEKMVREAEKPLQEEADKAKADLGQCREQSDALLATVAASREQESKYYKRRDRCLKDVKKCNDEADQLKADITIQLKKIQEQKDATEQLGMERPDETELPAGRNADWFATKVDAMKRTLDKRRDSGDSLDKVTARYNNLRTAYAEAVQDNTQEKILHEELAQTLESRKMQLKSFRLYVGLKARHNFKKMVQTRSFEGRLKIDHGLREIDILVDTTGKAVNQGDEKSGDDAYQSVVGLSGGEKSFSNACFVTSMWEAMDCPLRCMDEYDVFMDAMNRTVTTKMLIDIARQHPHRQFVFLSPLGMKALKNMNETHNVNIIALKDPKTMKGQTTLSFGGE